MLKTSERNKLIEAFKKVRDLSKSEILDKIQNINDLSISLNAYLLYRKLELTDFDKISDFKLIMLCGIFRFCIPAGDYKYSKELNQSINNIDDIVCDLGVRYNK